MAWNERPSASLTYVLKDETGSTSTFALDVPQTTPMDVAMTAAGVMRPLVEAITDCAILSYSLTYSSNDDAPAAPAAGSRVERKGKFVFRTSAGKTVAYQVPGIADAVVLSDGRIDDDAAPVLAFTTAITALDAIFTDSNGANISSLKEAYERFSRTTRKQLPSQRQPD